MADTYTTNYNLVKIEAGTTGWADKANGNMDTIDTQMKIIEDTIVLGKKYFDVREYGAVGDGITDNITAIRNAVVACSNAGGGTVYFPAGNYAVGNKIYWPSNVCFLGDDKSISIISCKSGVFPIDTSLVEAASATGTLYTTSSLGSNGSIRRLKFDCTNMPAASGDGTGQGIYTGNMTYMIIDDVHILSSQGYGIHLAADFNSGYDQESPTITNCIFENCGVHGTQDTIGGANNINAIIAFNKFVEPNGTAIDNIHVKNALWAYNVVKSKTVTVSHQNCIWSDFGMTDSRIIGNWIENGSIHCFGNQSSPYFMGTKNVLIANNHIENGDILVSPANALITDSYRASGIRIIGNIINGCVGSGISIRDCPTAVIANNIIDYWDSGLTGEPAIILYGGPNPAIGSFNCVISGNSGNPGVTTLWYKEGTAGQSNNNHLSGNNFVTGTVSLDTTSPVSSFYSDVPLDIKAPKIANLGGGPQCYNAAFYAPVATMADQAGIGLGFDPSGGAGGVIAALTNATGQPLTFWTYNGSGWGERARIAADGLFTVPGVYSNTTATAANVNVDASGNIKRSTSSIKYKTDIREYVPGVETVKKLNPVLFKMKGEQNGRDYVGLIAEDLDKMGLKEYVTYDKDGNPDGIMYANLVVLLINAIKEISKRLE